MSKTFLEMISQFDIKSIEDLFKMVGANVVKSDNGISGLFNEKNSLRLAVVEMPMGVEYDLYIHEKNSTEDSLAIGVEAYMSSDKDGIVEELDFTTLDDNIQEYEIVIEFEEMEESFDADNPFFETLDEVKLKKTFKRVGNKMVKTFKVAKGHKDKTGRRGSRKTLQKSGMKKKDVKRSMKAKKTARMNPGAKRKRKITKNKSASKRLVKRNKRLNKK